MRSKSSATPGLDMAPGGPPPPPAFRGHAVRRHGQAAEEEPGPAGDLGHGERDQGDPGAGDGVLRSSCSVDGGTIQEAEETGQADQRQEQPGHLEGGRWLGSIGQYSSGSDKGQVLAEMTEHLGDPSRATDKGQVQPEPSSLPR